MHLGSAVSESIRWAVNSFDLDSFFEKRNKGQSRGCSMSVATDGLSVDESQSMGFMPIIQASRRAGPHGESDKSAVNGPKHRS